MQRTLLTFIHFALIGYCFPQKPIGKDSFETVAPRTTIQPTGNLTTPVVKPLFTIYPNPAKNKITLLVKGFEPGMVTVRIIDDKGKPIRDDDRLLINGNEEITMYLMLEAGAYFVLLKQKDKSLKRNLFIIY